MRNGAARGGTRVTRARAREQAGGFLCVALHHSGFKGRNKAFLPGAL